MPTIRSFIWEKKNADCLIVFVIAASNPNISVSELRHDSGRLWLELVGILAGTLIDNPLPSALTQQPVPHTCSCISPESL